jgi:CRISPR/Cas system-associated exonuclease Cas4 (RecB family)
MIFSNNFDLTSLGQLPDRGLQDLENTPIQISQSLLKDLGKETFCPRRLYESYILGKRTDAEEGTALHKGVCFEYFINESTGVGGKKPHIPTKKGGEMPVDYQRLKQQAHFLNSTVLPYYNFETYLDDVELTTEFKCDELPHPIFVRGRLDRLAFRDGKLCVIDFKATADIDNEYALQAWRSPSTMDHTQAYLYMWLFIRNKDYNSHGYIPDFYYFVFEWGPKSDYTIIQVKWEQSKFREVERSIIDGYNKMIDLHQKKWPKDPSYYECKDCPIKNVCDSRKIVKDIKIVQ